MALYLPPPPPAIYRSVLDEISSKRIVLDQDLVNLGAKIMYSGKEVVRTKDPWGYQLNPVPKATFVMPDYVTLADLPAPRVSAKGNRSWSFAPEFAQLASIDSKFSEEDQDEVQGTFRDYTQGEQAVAHLASTYSHRELGEKDVQDEDEADSNFAGYHIEDKGKTAKREIDHRFIWGQIRADMRNGNI